MCTRACTYGTFLWVGIIDAYDVCLRSCPSNRCVRYRFQNIPEYRIYEQDKYPRKPRRASGTTVSMTCHLAAEIDLTMKLTHSKLIGTTGTTAVGFCDEKRLPLLWAKVLADDLIIYRALFRFASTFQPPCSFNVEASSGSSRGSTDQKIFSLYMECFKVDFVLYPPEPM